MAKTKMENNCPNTKDVFILGINDQEKKGILFKPRCKQWSCDYCAEINKEYWIHQASRGALLITSEGREIQFVTLTSRSYASPNSSLYFFQQNWPKLNRRMKYHTNLWGPTHGKEWAYFLVPERHKSGVAHFHLLAVTHIAAWAIWKKHAHASGFGFIGDLKENIDPNQVANYVTKYLHKGIGAEQWPTDFRRVRHSQNWPIAQEQPLDDWRWLNLRNEDTAWLEKSALINMGYRVVDKTQ